MGKRVVTMIGLACLFMRVEAMLDSKSYHNKNKICEYVLNRPSSSV